LFIEVLDILCLFRTNRHVLLPVPLPLEACLMAISRTDASDRIFLGTGRNVVLFEEIAGFGQFFVNAFAIPPRFEP